MRSSAAAGAAPEGAVAESAGSASASYSYEWPRSAECSRYMPRHQGGESHNVRASARGMASLLVLCNSTAPSVRCWAHCSLCALLTPLLPLCGAGPTPLCALPSLHTRPSLRMSLYKASNVGRSATSTSQHRCMMANISEEHASGIGSLRGIGTHIRSQEPARHRNTHQVTGA